MKKRSRELNPKKQTLITNLCQCSAPSLIKHLASCNDTVRFQSLRLLQTWLTTTTETSEIVSDSDMKKLWKGLFYTLWHCDKAPAQSELINRLANLISILDLKLSVRFFRVFVITLKREWNGIDHLRLDKFYLCIRRFVKAVFGLLRKWGWDLGLLGEFVGVLEDDLFLGEDKLLGNGVGYHVVGVFLDELKGGFVPVRKEVVDLLFRPFFGVVERSLDKVLIGKVRGLVFEALLRFGKDLVVMKRDGRGVEGVGDGYDDVAFGLIAMRMGFAARFYEIGSSVDCVQGNRKVVLKLHEDFLKLEKMLESSGVEIVIPDVVLEDDDEEVPELVPIESSEVDGAMEQNDSVVAANGEADEGEDMVDDEDDARKRKKARKETDGRIKKAKTKKRKEKNNQPSDEDSLVPEDCAPVARDLMEAKNSSKKRKKKEKNNQPSEEDSLVPEDCALVTKDLVEASLTSKSKSSSKKSKKKEKKNEVVDSKGPEAALSSPVNVVSVKQSSSSCEPESNGDVLNESVIANLQKQFENVAAELGSDDGEDVLSLSDAFKSINEKPPTKKKTKKAKSCDPKKTKRCEGDVEANAAKSADGSAKKVRFSMKNNLVWKPHSPLPPQSLRIPPSVTPRGSALKKGVRPGPIREVSPAKKRLKKKGGKILKRSVWR